MQYFNKEDMEEAKRLAEQITKNNKRFLSLAVSMLENTNIPDRLFTKDDLINLYELLQENSVYRVQVKTTSANVKHESILLTGYKNGSYWVVVNNSYGGEVQFRDLYSIRIEEYLCSMGRSYLQENTDESNK